MEGSSAWFVGNGSTEEAETVTIVDHATNIPYQILVFKNYPDGFRTKKMVDRGMDANEIAFIQFQWDEAKSKCELEKYKRISSSPSTPRVLLRSEVEQQPCEQPPRKKKPDCIPAPKGKGFFGAKLGPFGARASPFGGNPFKVNNVQFNH